MYNISYNRNFSFCFISTNKAKVLYPLQTSLFNLADRTYLLLLNLAELENAMSSYGNMDWLLLKSLSHLVKHLQFKALQWCSCLTNSLQAPYYCLTSLQCHISANPKKKEKKNHCTGVALLLLVH